MIAKVFCVLKWTSKELERTIAVLLEEGAIQKSRFKGAGNSQLVSNQPLGQTSLGASAC